MVGMSGGVDSSVAAYVLKEQGLNLAGLFMQNWNEDGSGDCRAEDDRRDALKICGLLGIPFYARNFADQYWSGVFEHFIAEYRAGRTPNPHVLCNKEIKFKTFLDEALQLGADKIATGHYAQVRQRDGLQQLLRGADHNKDQSYFLHQLGQAQLAATLFPIGHLPKDQVRAIAQQQNFPTAAKKDSTGICFIGERDFRSFLAQYLPAKAGVMRTPEGDVLGEHSGVFYYTLGQREGLNIGGVKGREQAPWFVVGKDVPRNELIVEQGGDNPWLNSQQLLSERFHWIAGSAPATQFRCSAKTRYRQSDSPCEVWVQDDGAVRLRFDQPERAVTPGQSLVLYADEVCLGGAVILATDAPLDPLRDKLAA